MLGLANGDASEPVGIVRVEPDKATVEFVQSALRAAPDGDRRGRAVEREREPKGVVIASCAIRPR
jgi:hypothetical protein